MLRASPDYVNAIRIGVALLFIIASIAKLRALPTFEGVVANYRLLPPLLTRPFAWSLPVAELLLGLALPTGVAGAAWAAAALLLLFAFAMGVNLARGRTHIDCGCFSSTLRQPLRVALLVRNVVLAVLVLSTSPGGRPAFDDSLWLGVLGGVAIFSVIQGLNAVLAIPSLKRRRAHG